MAILAIFLVGEGIPENAVLDWAEPQVCDRFDFVDADQLCK